MIDQRTRLDRLRRRGRRPDVHRAAARRRARARRAPGPGRRAGAGDRGRTVTAATPAATWPWWSRCAGPTGDPQGPTPAGASAAARAGAAVFLSNAAAARAAVGLVRRPPHEPARRRAARRRGRRLSCSPTRWRRRPCRSTQVDWRPPLGEPAPSERWPGCWPTRAGPRPTRAAVGADARRRRRAGRRPARPPRRWAWRPARSCTPGRRSAGTRASGPLRGALIGAMLLEGLADDPEEAEAGARRR